MHGQVDAVDGPGRAEGLDQPRSLHGGSGPQLGPPPATAMRPGLLMRLGDPFGGERHAQTVQLHPDPSLGVAVARTLRAGPAGGITPRCTPPVESLGGGRPGRYTLVPSEVSP